uniref:Uncharacterized protein n=1 Tax=Hyaloperonospora arabidopsidis (strain Emoy2) TaxID=559515 RepID=M4BCN8_HYAAE
MAISQIRDRLVKSLTIYMKDADCCAIVVVERRAQPPPCRGAAEEVLTCAYCARSHQFREQTAQGRRNSVYISSAAAVNASLDLRRASCFIRFIIIEPSRLL